MGFGKRKVKKGDHANDENNKKSVDKSHSDNSGIDDINSVCNTSDNNIKQKRTYGFMKKGGGKSSGLLFGQTKEEKLKLYIYNLKLLRPNMPVFWQQKEIDKFKKKFDI